MAQMLKKSARQGFYCDNRHCVSSMDANMRWYSPGSQRQREKREWMKEVAATKPRRNLFDWTER